MGLGVRYFRLLQAQQAAEVEQVVAAVLQDLQARKETGDPGVVVEHLRDKHLQSSKGKSRQSLWRQVQAAVQADSRVNEYAAFKNGAQVTDWEWVG